MSEHVHKAMDNEGRGDLDVSEFEGGIRDGRRRGRMLQFTITEYDPRLCDRHGASRLISLDYRAAEKLWAALGAWLMDMLISGEVHRG